MQFIVKFGRSFGTVEEYNFRRNLWIESDRQIRAHNEGPKSPYKLGHNNMSDWT